MAELYVNVNGTWKQASNYYVNVNGTWKEGSELHAKVSSAWKESGVYGGTSGIVSTNIVLDLNTTNSSSYGGSGTTWSDISGNGYNTTLFNSPAYSSDEGGYLNFDGTNDYATFNPGSDIAFGTGEFAFEMWTNFVGEGAFNIIDTRNTSQGVSNWSLYMEDTEKLNWHTGSASNFQSDSSMPTWSTGYNGWNHIVFTREGTGSNEFKAYINGVYTSAVTSSHDYSNSSTEVSIARRHSALGGDYFYMNGKISQIRIYKGKSLTASEVLQNYLATGSNYFGGIITNNLVLHLDASNRTSYSGSGTTWGDISGQGNNATLVNGPTFDSTHGGSIVFDGTNDSVTISGMSSFAPSAITFEVWFLNTPASGYKGLLDKGRDNYEGYSLAVNASKIIWKARVGSSNEFAFDSDQYQDSVWTHAVGTYDGTDLKLYVNATLKTTTNASGTLGSNNHGITIGSTNDSLYFDGRISQARIYSSALSASQVLQNYNATKSNYTSLITTNLVLHLNAGDSNSYSGSGTTWTDLSGQGNHATLTNGPVYSSSDGGYFDFDGTNDRADLTAGSDFAYGTGDFTIEIWFNVTGTSPQTYGERLFTQTTGGQNYFKVGVADGNPVVKQLYFKYGTGGGNRIRSGFEYTVDQWHHYIVTRNGTTVTQYVDGSLEETTTGVSFDFDNTTYNPTIAAMTNNNAQNLDGKIAQVRVYKGKGFSASEVLQNYNATKATYGY